MRFLHTSDWQIGKTFRFAEEASQTLRDERLDAITRLGKLARAYGAPHILVAGDVYDVETPSERTLRQPIERMRAAEDTNWHLIPGNHDSHTTRGPWERLKRLAAREGLPPNIHLHLDQQPAALSGTGTGAGTGAWLLPAALTARHTAHDPTEWMDAAPTPEGALRIGLAHGSVTSFGTHDGATPNRLSPDRPASAGLAYLALGDWHGALQISPRCHYSGTPETDDFGVGGNGGGTALLVEIEGLNAPPTITTHRTGRFSWHKLETFLGGPADIATLEARLRALAADLGTELVWLKAAGTLSLEAREAFESRIQHGVGSALRVLRLDDTALLPDPTPADLAAIDPAGFVRVAADRLAAQACDPANPQRAIAAAALQRLFVLAQQAPQVARR